MKYKNYKNLKGCVSMLEERGFNGYGFSLAFKWYETTDGYRERHPDNSGACNPDLMSKKDPVTTNRKAERTDNVFYLFGGAHYNK